ncbi:hypothetical protein CVD25_10255 [Bacillus canaveralius]|uniref:Uncharacterized protein n=1 Tax=Bacillus canaveralius TaxID=1403243 RepID=A0A2N5GM96_9BACI|nr:hypothetical protein CU635_10945 [Bacillus canaveralius]PLR87940.1 hypothetical protein CVD23_00365 [Bacillus sp. V33-4]PLR97014.1 hypothetical protein CVD25_10255 [Bacillus canaveralius]
MRAHLIDMLDESLRAIIEIWAEKSLLCLCYLAAISFQGYYSSVLLEAKQISEDVIYTGNISVWIRKNNSRE